MELRKKETKPTSPEQGTEPGPLDRAGNHRKSVAMADVLTLSGCSRAMAVQAGIKTVTRAMYMTVLCYPSFQSTN
jgi:hypothetical protein